MGDIRLTTLPVPKTTDKWMTLISVTPPDADRGGVEKWIWLSHPGQVATPQDLSMHGRILFSATKVTISTAEMPPIEFQFSGAGQSHLIGAWRKRHESEALTHEQLEQMMIATLERNGG
jgi:hypothetical protein